MNRNNAKLVRENIVRLFCIPKYPLCMTVLEFNKFTEDIVGIEIQKSVSEYLNASTGCYSGGASLNIDAATKYCDKLR